MAETEAVLYELMAQKLEILQSISTNTTVQIRFIKQRKLKGLHRLLDEQARYLQKLAALNDEFNRITDNDASKGTFGDELKLMALAIQVKEREINCAGGEALKVAGAERDKIIADLNKVRARKKLNRCYTNRWTNLVGKHLNRLR